MQFLAHLVPCTPTLATASAIASVVPSDRHTPLLGRREVGWRERAESTALRARRRATRRLQRTGCAMRSGGRLARTRSRSPPLQRSSQGRGVTLEEQAASSARRSLHRACSDSRMRCFGEGALPPSRPLATRCGARFGSWRPSLRAGKVLFCRPSQVALHHRTCFHVRRRLS